MASFALSGAIENWDSNSEQVAQDVQKEVNNVTADLDTDVGGGLGGGGRRGGGRRRRGGRGGGLGSALSGGAISTKLTGGAGKGMAAVGGALMSSGALAVGLAGAVGYGILKGVSSMAKWSAEGAAAMSNFGSGINAIKRGVGERVTQGLNLNEISRGFLDSSLEMEESIKEGDVGGALEIAGGGLFNFGSDLLSGLTDDIIPDFDWSDYVPDFDLSGFVAEWTLTDWFLKIAGWDYSDWISLISGIGESFWHSIVTFDLSVWTDKISGVDIGEWLNLNAPQSLVDLGDSISDLVDDFEFNVPDAIQTLVDGDWDWSIPQSLTDLVNGLWSWSLPGALIDFVNGNWGWDLPDSIDDLISGNWSWPAADKGLSKLLSWAWPAATLGLSKLLSWGWPKAAAGLSDLTGWDWPGASDSNGLGFLDDWSWDELPEDVKNGIAKLSTIAETLEDVADKTREAAEEQGGLLGDLGSTISDRISNSLGWIANRTVVPGFKSIFGRDPDEFPTDQGATESSTDQRGTESPTDQRGTEFGVTGVSEFGGSTTEVKADQESSDQDGFDIQGLIDAINDQEISIQLTNVTELDGRQIAEETREVESARRGNTV